MEPNVAVAITVPVQQTGQLLLVSWSFRQTPAEDEEDEGPDEEREREVVMRKMRRKRRR